MTGKSPCKACDGHGFIANGTNEWSCEDCGGTGEIDVPPDAYCVTAEDGSCVSDDPRCVHQPKAVR